MSSATQSAAAASRWGIISLAVAAGVIAAMQVGKVPPTMPLIAEDLALSRVSSGLVASLFFVRASRFIADDLEKSRQVGEREAAGLPLLQDD